MKAFILAAGKGERMRPLTDHLPKPLLPIDQRTLLDCHIEKLVAAGVRDIVINVAYLGHLIEAHVGDGHRYGASITFSRETEPLETAGAIAHASELLGAAPFLLVNGDVWSELDYSGLLARANNLPVAGGHLVLVNNPEHNPEGDFSMEDGYLQLRSSISPNYTFSGVSIMSPDLVMRYPKRRRIFPLLEVLHWGIAQSALSAELYNGYWLDVGTPERLESLRAQLSGR